MGFFRNEYLRNCQNSGYAWWIRPESAGTAKNDNVSKTKQENLTPDATFIAGLIATFFAMCCTC